MAIARLAVIDENDKETGTVIPAQFDPQSLRVSNRAMGPIGGSQNQSEGTTQAARTRQGTTFSSGLTVELFFDTTQDDKDVQVTVNKIINLVKPRPPKEGAPPKDITVKERVCFQFGTFLFRGTLDSADVTYDYFSETGHPKRATVSLSMSSVDGARIAEGSSGGVPGTSPASAAGVSASLAANASLGLNASASLNLNASVGTQPLTLATSGESLQSLSGRAKVDWRAVATANNIDNPRKLQGGAVLNLQVK